MASIIKRGRSWRALIAKKGVRDARTFDAKQHAVNWAAKREAEILAGWRGELPTHLMSEALQRYADNASPKKRGERWERVRLARFKRTIKFAGRVIAEVTSADIADWRDCRLKEVSTESVRREWTLLRSVFELARLEWKWIAANPMTGVKRPPPGKARDRVFSQDETERMILALGYARGTVPRNVSQRLAVALLIALETGMRSGELFSLEWPQVRLAQRYVALDTSKNGDGRLIPLSTGAAALFGLLPHDGDSVFNVRGASADVLFRKARKRAKIINLHFHDARATAVTMLSRKLDILSLAAMIGHRDLKSLQTYFRPSVTELAARLG